MLNVIQRNIPNSFRGSRRLKHILLSVKKKVPSVDYADPKYFDKQSDELDISAPGYIDKVCGVWHEMMITKRDLVTKREDLDFIRYDSSKWLPEIKPLQPKSGYDQVPELQNAPEMVRQMFSIEYGTRKDKTTAWKNELMDTVKTHPMDTHSLQAKIASHTTLVRQWTLLVEEFKKFSPRAPSRLVALINLSLAHRRRLLRILRERDEAMFNHVVQQLRISYLTPILPEDEPEQRRKAWVEHQVTRRLKIEKEKKLSALQELLERESKKRLKNINERLLALDGNENKLKKEMYELDGIIQSGHAPTMAKHYPTSEVESMYERNATGYFYMNVDKKPSIDPVVDKKKDKKKK